MKGSHVLRSGAVVLALTAIADPACTWNTSTALPVLVRPASPEVSHQRLAEAVRARLASSLRGRIDLDSPEPAAAIVFAGEPLDLEALPSGIPVFSVSEAGLNSRNVRVVGTSVPPVVLAGWTTTLSAAVNATGMEGETSIIVLEHEEVEIGRIEHRWTSASETFEADFPYVPPGAGTSSMRIVARALEDEVTSGDNQADFRVTVEDRALKILMHAPRPSWGTVFVRRVLEEEPLFEVASLVRPTRGVEVRSGAPPQRLTHEALESFDAVIVGAPEELNASEVEALASFARVRGGTFILVPDRCPSGPYGSLIPAASFEERLLERPIAVTGAAGGLNATELAVPVRTGPAADTVASFADPKGRAAVVISWPIGTGRGVFSGALDAWRHRASGDGFASFWRAHVASAASSAPRRIEAVLEPALASPGQTVVLRVRVRPTDFASDEGAIRTPVVAASQTDPTGATDPIRLWPTEETGVFEGRFRAPAPGHHAIQVSSRNQATFATVLIVAADARAAAPAASATQRVLVETSGGVSAGVADLISVDSHLSALPRAQVARSIHVARSPWWMAAFVSLLCGEWAFRRRRGAR